MCWFLFYSGWLPISDSTCLKKVSPSAEIYTCIYLNIDIGFRCIFVKWPCEKNSEKYSGTAQLIKLLFTQANTQLQTTLSVAAFKEKPGGNVLLGVSTTNGNLNWCLVFISGNDKNLQ